MRWREFDDRFQSWKKRIQMLPAQGEGGAAGAGVKNSPVVGMTSPSRGSGRVFSMNHSASTPQLKSLKDIKSGVQNNGSGGSPTLRERTMRQYSPVPHRGRGSPIAGRRGRWNRLHSPLEPRGRNIGGRPLPQVDSTMCRVPCAVFCVPSCTVCHVPCSAYQAALRAMCRVPSTCKGNHAGVILAEWQHKCFYRCFYCSSFQCSSFYSG